MVVIGDEDFVSGLEVDAFHHYVAALAGIAGDGDLVGAGAQHGRQLGAQAFVHGLVLVAILEGGVGVKVAQEFQMPVEHRPRGGAHVGRV